MQAAAVPQAASLAEATGLTITADDGQPLVEGVDYEIKTGVATTAVKSGTTSSAGSFANLIVLKTESAVTVTGTSKDNYGLQVAAGVHANITFNGVAIAAPVPFGMVTSLNGHGGHHAACLRHQRRPGHPQNVGASCILRTGKGENTLPGKWCI